MDYGAFNQLIGREVDQAFWGTRTEHIVGVAACLAVTDHASQKIFSSYLGRELCFAKARLPRKSHPFFVAVMLFSHFSHFWPRAAPLA